MLVQNEKQWAEVLRAALAEYLEKKRSAVAPAAPLKPLLSRRAEQAGLSYPPAGMERTKFSDFLALFPAVVSLKRRLGQDVLVSVAGDEAALQTIAADEAPDSTGKTPLRRLRSDVFKAFTRLPPVGRVYAYAKTNDRFTEIDQSIGSRTDMIHVPAQTLDAALAERREFTENLPETSARVALLAALQADLPLGAFGQAVKEHGLGQHWHEFRMGRLLKNIQEWADENGLSWNPDWMGNLPASLKPANAFTSREANTFLAGMMQLSPEDAQRVMIPLDIVLKLLRQA